MLSCFLLVAQGVCTHGKFYPSKLCLYLVSLGHAVLAPFRNSAPDSLYHIIWLLVSSQIFLLHLKLSSKNPNIHSDIRLNVCSCVALWCGLLSGKSSYNHFHPTWSTWPTSSGGFSASVRSRQPHLQLFQKSFKHSLGQWHSAFLMLLIQHAFNTVPYVVLTLTKKFTLLLHN